MNSAPIGIFDSGVGGLTVLKELFTCLPGERLIYLGDTARLPYGTKSKDTVIRYALNNAAFLVGKGVKLLVVACNTASSLALEELRNKFTIPVIGVIEPGAQKAARQSKTRKIGVIGTAATIRSMAYKEAIQNCSKDIEVISVACPLFVPLAEEGWFQDDITIRVAKRYLSPFTEQGIDVLVLGCTHYPLLKPVVSQVMGKEVLLIDSAEAVADQVALSLKLNQLQAEGVGDGSTRALTICLTDRSQHFIKLGEKILETPLNNTEYVDIG